MDAGNEFHNDSGREEKVLCSPAEFGEPSNVVYSLNESQECLDSESA
jgi:hypothetical protein